MIKKIIGYSNPDFPPDNAADANTDTYWESPAAGPWDRGQDDHRRFIDIHLDGLYDLDSVRIINPVRGSVYYHYQVYAGPNGDCFTKIASKSDNSPAVTAGDMHDVGGKDGSNGVGIVRVQVSFASDRFPVSVREVELHGKKVPGNVPARKQTEIAKFEDTEWAKRFKQFETEPDCARQRVISEMSALASRVIGEKWKGFFVFELNDTAGNGLDAFELEYIDGKVVIRGRNGVSMASGFNYYLKNYARVNYNPLFAGNTDMPEVLPAFNGKITKRTNYDKRYALNFCTFSYTMAFWGWAEFEAYLDYAAMNGVNLMLQLVGQEEVLVRFLENFGYTLDDVLEYISGPGYFAWFYMQNMTGWGGPLPYNWLYQRVELGRLINDRMQTYGMCPVLQGFSGMVPVDFRQKLNEHRGVTERDPGYWPQYQDGNDARNSIAAQGEWAGFKRPDMIRTISASGNYFAEIAGKFYKAQSEVFGNVSNYYAVDPFHEGGNIQGMNRTGVYKTISQEMVKADPCAVWLIQQWGNSVSAETLQGIDRSHVLVLDLNSEMRSLTDPMEQTGTKWLWNMLHNFGGRMGIFGDLPVLATGISAAFTSKKYMAGIGVTPEAYAGSGIMYDLLHDMTWHDSAINCREYVQDYIHGRYGDFNGGPEQNALAGWKIIADTALAAKVNYVQGPPESVINSRPTENFISASTWGHSTYNYEPLDLEKALPHFIEAYKKLGNKDTFRFDFVELTVQVLSTATLEIHRQMMAAYSKGEKTEFFNLSEKFLNAIRLADEILSASPHFGVGRWINSARNMLPEMDDWTRDLFEFNARTLITTWGGQKNGALKDYSNRQWSGLTSGLYLPRWEKFVNAYRTALETGNALHAPCDQSYFLMEWEWANRKSDETGFYPTGGTGNLQELAVKVWKEFSLTNMDGYVAVTRSDISTGRSVEVVVPGRTEPVQTEDTQRDS